MPHVVEIVLMGPDLKDISMTRRPRKSVKLAAVALATVGIGATALVVAQPASAESIRTGVPLMVAEMQASCAGQSLSGTMGDPYSWRCGSGPVYVDTACRAYGNGNSGATFLGAQPVPGQNETGWLCLYDVSIPGPNPLPAGDFEG
jgi:hypothetical protein